VSKAGKNHFDLQCGHNSGWLRSYEIA